MGLKLWLSTNRTFVQVIARLVVVFGNNTAINISKLFKISRAAFFSSVTPHKCNSLSIFLVFCALWRLIPLKCPHLHTLNDKIVRHLVCLVSTFIFPYLEGSGISIPWNTTPFQIRKVKPLKYHSLLNTASIWNKYGSFWPISVQNFLCLYYKRQKFENSKFFKLIIIVIVIFLGHFCPRGKGAWG